MNEYECPECGTQFITELLNCDEGERVLYCPVCGERIEEDLDENFYENDDL